MGTGITLAPDLGHRPALDGIRALAVVLVAGVHTQPRLIPGGSIGVDVFFVLSGFLITTLLCEERDGNGRIQFGRFYARRALRLLPALLGLLAAVTAWAVLVADDSTRRAALDEVVAAITYTRNLPIWEGTPGTLLGHTWSLAVEEQFYVLWPFVLTLAVRPRRSATGFAWLLVGVTVLFGVLRASGRVGPGLLFAQRPDAVLLGGAVALFRRERASEMRRRIEPIAVHLVVLGAAGLVALACWDGADTIDSLGFSLAALLAVLLTLGLLHAGQAGPASWFTHRAVIWLGRRSYGFYLWHMPVLRWTDDRLVGQPALVRIPAGLALALLATAASFRFLEAPALRWKNRLRPVVIGLPAATARR